jgi:hypothetical protein
MVFANPKSGTTPEKQVFYTSTPLLLPKTRSSQVVLASSCPC